MMARLFTVMTGAALAFAALGPTAYAADSDFYRGKTIRFVVGTAAGGGYSAAALFLAAHWPRHIPGGPAIAVEHMAGASGMKATNYIANAAPKDGTVVGFAFPNFWINPYVEPESVRFDPAQFRFVGRVSGMDRALAVWRGHGVETIDDLKKKEVVIAATARRSIFSIQPYLMNKLLGTRMKIVTGYAGAGPTLLALERGEAQGTTVGWLTLKAQKPHWIAEDKVILLGALNQARSPQGEPLVSELIKDPDGKALWDFAALPGIFGTAILIAPGVADERLATLRAAFDATVKDPTYLADAEKRRIDVSPRGGAELDALHRRYGKPSPKVVEGLKEAMGIQ